MITRRSQHLKDEPQGDALPLKLSDGWLTKFSQRHGLCFRPRFGVSGSVDWSAVESGRRVLQALTDHFDLQDIFNMNEACLSYVRAPSRSICSRGVVEPNSRPAYLSSSTATTSNAGCLSLVSIATLLLPHPYAVAAADFSRSFCRSAAQSVRFTRHVADSLSLLGAP